MQHGGTSTPGPRDRGRAVRADLFSLRNSSGRRSTTSPSPAPTPDEPELSVSELGRRARLHVATASRGTAGAALADGLTAGTRLTGLDPETRPTAVFCANDLIAAGVVQTATRNGWRIPDDLAVVGFDDTDLASAASAVELTSVRQPAADIGAAAVRLILERMADPHRPARDVVFEPHLVIRESTTARPR